MVSDSSDERWADCPGYVGLYTVSDRGRVYNLSRQKLLTGAVKANGYRQVRLNSPDRRVRCLLVHALVLGAFVGPRPPGHVCDHKSGNRLENDLTNLEWVTPSENLRRAYAAGRVCRHLLAGEGHYGAKLTDAKVRAIRQKHTAGVATRALACEFGVKPDTVRKVVARARWGHLD